VTRSTKSKYKTMTLVTCELIGLKQLLKVLKYELSFQMHLICDNQAAVHITFNPVFHGRTKYIKMDCHSIEKNLSLGTLQRAMYALVNSCLTYLLSV